jgi:hypothetical protein
MCFCVEAANRLAKFIRQILRRIRAGSKGAEFINLARNFFPPLWFNRVNLAVEHKTSDGKIAWEVGLLVSGVGGGRLIDCFIGFGSAIDFGSE